MHAIRIAAATVAATLLLLGTAPANAMPSDACALLTDAQVSAAMGIKALPGKRFVPSDPNICVWSDVSDPSIGDRRLMLSIISTDSFDRGKVPLEGITKEPVDGIGSDAYYITTPGFGTALTVKEGGSAFRVRVLGGEGAKAFSDTQTKAIEKTLAQEVLAKL
jgi:hypothetical protein